MEKILLRDNLSEKQKKIAIEMSLLMGFVSEYSEFPIFSFIEGIEVPETFEEIKNIINIEEKTLANDYISSTKSARPIEKTDNRMRKGLESIFIIEDFLQDENNDQLVDKLNFKIIIPENCSLEILGAACNFAFRFGMETTEYQGPIVGEQGDSGNLLVFEDREETGMEFQGKIDRKIVCIYGNGQAIIDFSKKICEEFPKQKNGKIWMDIIEEMRDSLAMTNLDGQLAYLLACQGMLQGDIKAYLSPKVESRLAVLEKAFPQVEFYNYKAKKEIYSYEYDIPWEVDIFKNILESEIDPKLKEKDRVNIWGVLSEDIKSRTKLKLEIEEVLGAKGIYSEINIISAYKQGFSWIEEIIIPQLKNQAIENIEIEFKPFLPKGETQWIDEDGMVPSYSNIDGDSSEKWLDIPMRYLQELYPIDDILAEKLGISREKIIFKTYQGEKDITYKIKALNKAEDLLLEKEYKAICSERPYIDEYEEMGKVHPSTGYIAVEINDEVVLEKRIKTDMENIWDIYQQKVLPDAKNFIDEKISKDIKIEQPYFSQLKIEIEGSEPDYRLGIREDMISTLDSLHEDIYFVGNDYFKKYGMKHYEKTIDAPGLILPIINKSQGKPKFKVTMYDQLKPRPSILVGNSLVQNRDGKDEIELYIKRINYIDGKTSIDLVTNVNDNFAKAYSYLMEKDMLEIENDFIGFDSLRITTDNKASFKIDIKSKDINRKDLNILNIDIMEDKLIGYDEYIQIIEQLKRVEGIEVYKIAESYMGRDVYAIEIGSSGKGYISKTKRITNYPSLVINARHHANEVSSTNAAFIMLRKILTEEKYKNLGDKLNLVIIPMANTDGTAIHYELQKDNPNWKLHVARFNGVGKEFYHEHFNPKTIHTEAMGVTRIWEKQLPDVIVDNHGVPSHEWAQQFSGYTSPSYKGFWLPRSILYGYFWTINDMKYKDNIILNKEIEEVVALAVKEDKELNHWNKEWISIFEKYAHGWMPKLFPADYYKDMINYWIDFKFDEKHRYTSIRFPWITTVCYTSEVADETAQGDYLYTCAKAHVVHDEAIIDMLINSKSVFESRFSIDNDKIKAKFMRHRPIIIENN